MSKFIGAKKRKIVVSILIVLSLIGGTTVKLVSAYNKKQEILKNEKRIAAEKAIAESKAREKAEKELAESRETKVKLNENITPDTILNGIGASKAKELIERQRVICYKEGMNEEKTRKFLSEMAEREFGTTLAALENLEINEPIVSNPDTPVSNENIGSEEVYLPPVQPVQQSQPSQPNQSGGGTFLDENGNVVSLDDYMITGELTTESDPNFILYMPGEEPND